MRSSGIPWICVTVALAAIMAASAPAYAGRRMLVLIDGSGSMNTSRNNTDGRGATRFEAAKTLSRQHVLEQADADQNLLVAVYTFHDAQLLLRHTGPDDLHAFVDPNTARTAIANLGTADATGTTPLAGAMCRAGDTLHIPAAEDIEILQVSSDGEENATPMTDPCAGPQGTCDLVAMTCAPPESWQARVLAHLTQTSAAIVKVDLFNSAPVVGALASQHVDSQTRTRAPTPSLSSELMTLEQFFTVLMRDTGGTLNVILDNQLLPVYGDLNNDFCTDRTDAILVARTFGPLTLPTDNGRYDLNLDRVVDFADYQIQVARITPACGPDPYVPSALPVCKGGGAIVIDHQSIEDDGIGGTTVEACSACEIIIKNSLIVSGQNAITVTSPAAKITIDDSIVVGPNAVVVQRGGGVISARNTTFHGQVDFHGSLQFIDRGGNVFE